MLGLAGRLGLEEYRVMAKSVKVVAPSDKKPETKDSGRVHVGGGMMRF